MAAPRLAQTRPDGRAALVHVYGGHTLPTPLEKRGLM